MIYNTKSNIETKELAGGLALSLNPGSLLALVGELGSGKTCFVQGLASGLNFPEMMRVTSPTFTLAHEYLGGRLPLYHFDFYRLNREEEASNLGLEEYWDGDGVSVVEWADQFPNLFPEKTIWIRFKVTGENSREIQC